MVSRLLQSAAGKVNHHRVGVTCDIYLRLPLEMQKYAPYNTRNGRAPGAGGSP